MASPLFDALHLKLARLVDDPVAAAATNGAELSSALRTDYLNRASRYIQNSIWKLGKDRCVQLLSGLVGLDVAITASGVKAVPTDYAYPLAFYKTDGTWATYVDPEYITAGLLSNRNPDITLAYTVYGGYVRAWDSAVSISNNIHPFWYLKNDQRASSGDTADISIDSIWYDVLVDLAASFHFADKGDATKAGLFLARANNAIAQLSQ